jgi:hypothetical protein
MLYVMLILTDEMTVSEAGKSSIVITSMSPFRIYNKWKLLRVLVFKTQSFKLKSNIYQSSTFLVKNRINNLKFCGFQYTYKFNFNFTLSYSRTRLTLSQNTPVTKAGEMGNKKCGKQFWKYASDKLGWHLPAHQGRSYYMSNLNFNLHLHSCVH